MTVPGALVDGVLPFLGGASTLNQKVTPSVAGTNTDPATATAPVVDVPVGPHRGSAQP